MKEFIVQAYAPNTIKTFEEHNAPEIVRCKDCKHFDQDGIYTMCYRHNGLSQNEDWFCAYGERKEGR